MQGVSERMGGGGEREEGRGRSVHEARGMESTWQHGKAWEWGVGVGCEAFVLGAMAAISAMSAMTPLAIEP